MTFTAEAITIRTYYSDAGIRTTWLVGHWPTVTKISSLFVDGSDESVTTTDEIIEINMLNASARYRIVERCPMTQDVVAVLEASEIRAHEAHDA